jgi:predicted amidohydrolase
VRVAAVQLTSTADRERNLAIADRLTRDAAAAGAELVVLPEKWSVLGTPEETAAGAEPFDGPAITWAGSTARELGIDLVAGSIAERVEGREKGSNTSVHFGPDGEVRAVYRKIHMFDVEVGGRTYRESAHEEGGDEVVLSETAGGVELGLTVC